MKLKFFPFLLALSGAAVLADSVRPTDLVIITRGNQLWHLPAADSSGVGHALLTPAGPLWGVTADLNGLTYYVYRKEPNDILVRVKPDGTSEDLATIPTRGGTIKLALSDIAAGPTGNIYIAYRQDGVPDCWIAKVGADRKVIDLQNGREVLTGFSSQSFPAPSGAVLAVNSKDELFVSARPRTGEDPILYRAAPGVPLATLTRIAGLRDIGFTAGDRMWGSFSIPGRTDIVSIGPVTIPGSAKTDEYQLPQQALPTILAPGYITTNWRSDVLVAIGGAKKFSSSASGQTLGQFVELPCNDCPTAAVGANSTVAQVPGDPRTVAPPCPSQDWTPHCIIIERRGIEINGAQYRAKGELKAFRIAKHSNPRAPEPKLFATIQEAIDFAGVDACNPENDLSFRSFDTVKICTNDFREADTIIVPRKHRVLGSDLASISLIGEGRGQSTIIESGLLFDASATESTPNLIANLTVRLLGLSFRSGILSLTPIRISNVEVFGLNLETGIFVEDAAEIRDSSIRGCQTGIGSHGDKARGNLKVNNVTFDFTGIDVLDSTRVSGLDVFGHTLLASNLTFRNQPRNGTSIDLFRSSGDRVEIARLEGEPSRLLHVDGLVTNSSFRRLQGGSAYIGREPDPRFTVRKDTAQITITDSEFRSNPFTPAITVDGADDVLIRNTKALGSSHGAFVRNSLRLSLIGNQFTDNSQFGIRVENFEGRIFDNLIARNVKGGVELVPGYSFSFEGNTLANNGRFGWAGPQAMSKTLWQVGAPSVVGDNVIFGHSETGLELPAGGNFDLGGGTGGSRGGNILVGNGKFDLVNQSGTRISAKNNIWSSSDAVEILSKYVSPGSGGVDVAPVMPLRAIYFAQFAEAPGFRSTLTLSNPSRSNHAASLLAVRNAAGVGVDVKLNGNGSPGGLQPGAIAPLGARSFSTDPSTAAVNVGSILAASGRPLAGTVLFSGPAGVAGVGASELLTQFIAPVEKSAGKSVNSGIAITNPNTTAAVTVALRLRESSTGKITEGTLPLAAGGQAAKFIDELFSGLSSEFNGTLSVSAPAQVGATVIRTSPGQFATLPVTGAGSKKLQFAQFGEVSGVSSTLTFVNPSLDKTASVTVKIFDDNGGPMTVNLGGQDRPGQFTFSLPPQASASFASPGNNSAAKIGSVVVDSTENIGGTILFGGSFGLAGVGASQALSNFVAPVEQSTDGGVLVGLALMNLGSGQISVKLTLRDEGDAPIEGGTADIVLKSQGHVAQFLSQFFPSLDLKDFRGTITGETAGQIAATVIRQSGNPQEFATLPVAEIVP